MCLLFFFSSSLDIFFHLALTVDLLSNLLFQTRGIAVRVNEVYFCHHPRDIRLGLKAGERVHDFSSDDEFFPLPLRRISGKKLLPRLPQS